MADGGDSMVERFDDDLADHRVVRSRQPVATKSCGTFLTDRNGIVSDVNLDACVLVDLGRRYLIGKPLDLVFVRADGPRLARVLASVESSPAGVSDHVRLRTRTGLQRPVRIEGTLSSNGDHVFWQAWARSA